MAARDSERISMQSSVVHDVSRQVKARVSLVHLVVTVILLAALLACLYVWIWEEVTKPEMYYPEHFLDNPKFQEARKVLLVGYLIAALLLILTQCCLQVEGANPKESSAKGRRIIWSLTAIVLFLTFFGSSLLALFYRLDDLALLKSQMLGGLSRDYINVTTGDFTTTGRSFNTIQGSLHCCGVDGVSDYRPSFNSATGLDFPYSCCELKSGSQGSENVTQDDVLDWSQCQIQNADYFNSDGCYDKLYSGTRYMCTETLIIGFVASGLLLIGMILRLATETHFERTHEKYLDYLERRHMKHKGKVSLKGNKDSGPDKINDLADKSPETFQVMKMEECVTDIENDIENDTENGRDNQAYSNDNESESKEV